MQVVWLARLETIAAVAIARRHLYPNGAVLKTQRVKARDPETRAAKPLFREIHEGARTWARDRGVNRYQGITRIVRTNRKSPPAIFVLADRSDPPSLLIRRTEGSSLSARVVAGEEWFREHLTKLVHAHPKSRMLAAFAFAFEVTPRPPSSLYEMQREREIGDHI